MTFLGIPFRIEGKIFSSVIMDQTGIQRGMPHYHAHTLLQHIIIEELGGKLR